DGYCFFIELIRRWVATNKSLLKVKDELDRVVPLADTLYRSAVGFHRQFDLESAKDQLLKALRANPNHLKARLLLGQILLDQDRSTDAVKELEAAYQYDEDAARYPLIKALLIRGEELERVDDYVAASEIYKRVLELSPDEKLAQQRCAAIEELLRK